VAFDAAAHAPRTEDPDPDDLPVSALTLNRPERLNALGDTLREDLLDAVTRSSGDPAVRVIVLTGAGKGFCAGGDVKALAAW